MVAGYRQADFLAHFETTVWGEDDDVWRFHRVLSGKNDPAMVNSALELGITWTTHSEVPLEKVVCNHKVHRITQIQIEDAKSLRIISFLGFLKQNAEYQLPIV